MVMVVPAGMVSGQVPPMVPPLQVIDALVTLIGAVPLSVPPCMVSAGTLTVPALLRVSVPPETRRLPTLVMEPMVVVPPRFLVVPVMLYGALTLLVPAP